MTPRQGEAGTAGAGLARPKLRGRLFRKYVALFATVVCAALVTNVVLDVWFSYREQKALLLRIQREQAEALAERISQFVSVIDGQLGWATQRPWRADQSEEWQLDAARLLREVPAVTELAQLDAAGREQTRASRSAAAVIGSGIDRSTEPAFIEASAHQRYHGPVSLGADRLPSMTFAMADAGGGVVIAQVNLKFIWDAVSQIKGGKGGQALVVDANDRLIAHPDVQLALRNIDLSGLTQVRAARAERPSGPQADPAATDLEGHEVLSAHAPVPPLGWLVFVELPVAEAYAPLYASVLHSGALLAAALVLAILAGLFLARRTVVPIETLRDGAARIGGGDLTQRIAITTGDELEALGDQFNSMAERLQESHATLEHKVKQRTEQLALANLAKSRFLAAASHDLRQPLHALGLFVAQLREEMNAADRARIVERIDASVAAMNELFNALLDISKLDAGVLAPEISDFPVDRLLKRIEMTFAAPAAEKGLSLRVVPTAAWMRSDFILLERILFNLVSNAVRYTSNGGVVIGCRRRGGTLRIEVWDSGPGIAEDQRERIFGEFYRLESAGDPQGGLGLGLAIVDRLCRLLGHPIALSSRLHHGSRFTVVVPAAAAGTVAAAPAAPAPDRARGELVAVIDDDPLVLDGMGGLLRSWGLRVVAAPSGDAILARLGHEAPDLIISDYRLAEGRTGVELIERLRSAFAAAIPAFLISGDTNPERLREARIKGYHLLHKPVEPMTLRATVNQLLTKDRRRGALA